MKTTVEIADELLREAKAIAASERSTVRALLEEGLRWVLGQRRGRRRFRLRDASVTGHGLQPGIAEGSWDVARDLTYTGRGS
jgi:hypothetical protein